MHEILHGTAKIQQTNTKKIHLQNWLTMSKEQTPLHSNICQANGTNAPKNRWNRLQVKEKKIIYRNKDQQFSEVIKFIYDLHGCRHCHCLPFRRKKKFFRLFFILLFCLRHSTCVSSVCMCLCLWVIREQIYYCRNDVVLILTAAHFTRAMQCSMKFQCEVNNKNNICLHFKKILFSRQPSDGTYERLLFFKLFTECNYRWMQGKFIFDNVAQSIFVKNCFYFPIDLSFLWFFLLFGAPVHIRIVVFVVYLACGSMQLFFCMCLN